MKMNKLIQQKIPFKNPKQNIFLKMRGFFLSKLLTRVSWPVCLTEMHVFKLTRVVLPDKRTLNGMH